jgi:hypothetical protein
MSPLIESSEGFDGNGGPNAQLAHRPLALHEQANKPRPPRVEIVKVVR